jgi:hypothetical protein
MRGGSSIDIGFCFYQDFGGRGGIFWPTLAGGIALPLARLLKIIFEKIVTGYDF